MSKINVKFMTDLAVDTLKRRANDVVVKMKTNTTDSFWVSDLVPGQVYMEKKYKINDFTLKLPVDKYDEVDYENSILLFENLNCLPMHILTDERFWAWLNFEKFYEVALKAIPVKDKTTTFLDHYMYHGGSRRGIFFGVLSRCYFRVALSVDEGLEDKYELTKFVIENPERFRNLSWRTYSSRKDLVLATLKAEKAIYDKYGVDSSELYTYIAKCISKYGGIKMIDVVSEEDIYDYVYNKAEEFIIQSIGE